MRQLLWTMIDGMCTGKPLSLTKWQRAFFAMLGLILVATIPFFIWITDDWEFFHADLAWYEELVRVVVGSVAFAIVFVFGAFYGKRALTWGSSSIRASLSLPG